MLSAAAIATSVRALRLRAASGLGRCARRAAGPARLCSTTGGDDLLSSTPPTSPRLEEWRKYTEVGVALYRQGNLERAEACLNRAIDVLNAASLHTAEALRARAQTLLCIANCKRELVLSRPDDSQLKVEVGEIYTTVAETIEQNFGVSDPQLPFVFQELGRHLTNIGDHAAADAVLSRAFVLHTEYVEAARTRGVDAFALLLQRNAFIVDLARAMTHSGRGEEATKLEQSLQEALIVLDNADHSGIRSALAQMQAYYEVVGNDTKRDRIAKMLEEDDGSGVRPQGLRTADAGSAAEAEGEGKAEGHQALEDHRARVMYAWETVRARRAEEGKDPMGGVDLQTSPGDEHFAFELLRKDPEVQLEVLHMMNQKGQQGE